MNDNEWLYEWMTNVADSRDAIAYRNWSRIETCILKIARERHRISLIWYCAKTIVECSFALQQF